MLTEPALISERPSRNGPLTSALYRNVLRVYACLIVLGLSLFVLGTAFWQGFGLGLLLPGGGFFVGFTSVSSVLTGTGAVVLSVLLFGMGFLAWFGAGNILAPVAVWLGAALVAGWMAPDQGWAGAPVLLLGVLATGAAVSFRQLRIGARAAIANRDRRNQVLRTKVVAFNPDVRSEVRELDEAALKLYRHVLDRSLQPVESFNGLTWADQFQFGSLRYAICGMGYALAGVQHGATPAFSGYLSEAQRRLHQKMLDHRNWKYWAWENAWGNLSGDPNPIHHRDNIMYHGWFMAMLAEYISNTGDNRYNDQPLVLRHPDGREWKYTFSEICEILYRSHRKSSFTLFPCEPNWIYPMCNNFSAIALKIHDRLYKTSWFAEIEADYRRNFDNEFCTVDGRVLAIRSRFTGLTLPMLTSAMADSVTAHFQHGTFPDIARRSWEITRMDYIRVIAGEVRIDLKGWDKLDTGNYRPSLITTYGQIGAAAAEMGDTEVADLLKRRIQQEFIWDDEDGAATLRDVSSQGHCNALAHFSTHANNRRNMDARGMAPAQLKGPRLAQVPYPDVLVSYAVTDGGALDVVLRPGRRGTDGQVHTLRFEQLRPGARYRDNRGASLVADPTGSASLGVRMEGRTVLRLAPLE